MRGRPALAAGLCGFAIAALVATAASAVAAPAALATDPPIAAPPAAMAAMQMPSGDGAMNAIVYTPGGVGPHPAMILFHGLPGNEQNLDLAQAARRAGFVVLTLHYRGSWGSLGSFSFANAAADGINATDWLLAPEQLARFHIDKDRLVLGGHSVGGFVAMKAAAARPAVKGLMLLDAWNIGDKPLAALQAPGGVEQYRAGTAANVLPLTGTSTAALAAEILADGNRLDLRRDAAAVAGRPVLLIGAQRANGLSMETLATSIRAAGGKQVTGMTMPTDHGFNDHRVALISASLDWLQAIGRVGKPAA